MKKQWKKVWVKVTFWLVTEIILNLLGLDNLADYSEFIFEKEMAIAIHSPKMTIIVPFRNPHFDYTLPERFTIALNA